MKSAVRLHSQLRTSLFQVSLKLVFTVTALSGVLWVTASEAQILECRDENGKKMFATVCPKGFTQAREVEILKPPTEPKDAGVARAKTMKKLLEKDAEYRTRVEQQAVLDAIERDKQRKIADACYEERKKLKSLLVEGPYETGKDRDGNPTFMDEQTRQEKIKSLNEKLKQCPAE